MADGNRFLEPWKYCGSISLLTTFKFFECDDHYCLRFRCIVRRVPVTAKAGDGRYVLHHQSHFFAARRSEGQWQINLGRRTHTWHDVMVMSCSADRRLFWEAEGRKGKGMVLNLASTEAFQVSQGSDLGVEMIMDCKGGSGVDVGATEESVVGSPASTIYPRLPPFIDSEFSSSSVGSASAICAVHYPTRIAYFEGLLCDYVPLLAHQPSLFTTFPCPFLEVSDAEWIAELGARRRSLRILHMACQQHIQESSIDVSRVSKRLRAYCALLRAFPVAIQADPFALETIPNPCDSTVSKREWEAALCHQRRAWRQQGVDLLGGANVEICSAITGNPFTTLVIEFEDEFLAGMVRASMSALSSTPFFAVEVLLDEMDASSCLADNKSWRDCGFPDKVFVVQKPRSLMWTEEIFAAVENQDPDEVRLCLGHGQDPNAVCSDSLLSYAVAFGHAEIVDLLLCGGAFIHFIAPGQRMAPIHTAAKTSPAILERVLWARGDPNYRDLRGMTPLHHALCGATRDQEQIVDMLIHHGAEVMQTDDDGDSCLCLSPPGRCVALCLDHCWDQVSMLDLLQRHIEELVAHAWSPALWSTCSTLHSQRHYLQGYCRTPGPDVLAGSTSLHGQGAVDGPGPVSFHLACTGKEVCALHVVADCPILQLKQHVAICLKHLPFAVMLLQAGSTISTGCTWGDIGSPQDIGVVLTARRSDLGQALSMAVQNQHHETVVSILESGQEPDCMGEVQAMGRLEPVLLTAAAAGFFYSCHLLLHGFADPNIAGRDRRTAAHVAVLAESAMTLQVLLCHRADANARDCHGNTPLHLAAFFPANLQAVQQLIGAGADPLAPDVDGDPPLIWGHDVDTTAALMDGCWDRLSFLTLFLLNINNLSNLTGTGQLRCLCRSLCRHLRAPRRHPMEDIAAGSSSVNDAPVLEMLGGRKKQKQRLGESCSEATLMALRASHNRQIATFVRSNKKDLLFLPSPSFGVSLQSLGLHNHLPPLLRGYVQRCLLPAPPQQWHEAKSVPPVVDHLKVLHPHERDGRLVFQADHHLYFWDGIQTKGSVTGLIHRFSAKFDPDIVLLSMRRSKNWPRPQYLKPYIPAATMAYLEGCPETAELAGMLCARPRPDAEICEAARQVPCLPDLVSMSDATIKMLWERNSREASARGTWMHLEFEMLLNGHAVSAMSSEIKLFSKFLQQMKSGTAFRTEWAIFATEENLAGSIDFVALEPDGSLSLYDWKRTRRMLDKFNSFGKSMGNPLEHLPDATMWHYRLQLNVYKRILEKYYNATVSGMYVVGCHPDNGAQPFVDKVPFMETEANLLLEFQRHLALDALGGSSTAEANWPAWRQLLHSCMIPKVGPELYNRVSLQCKYYEEQVQPVMSVLRMHPALFFIIPSPLQTAQQLANWQFQLSATCWFLQLVRDKKVSLLEFGLFVFYKELVDVYPFMPDLIFASRVATSYEIWATCISSCLLLLHVLSGSIPSRRTLSARKAALSWIQSFGPQAMPHIETVQLADPLESIMKLWCSDCLGGAAAAMSLSQGSFADAIGAELEAMDAEERERERNVSVEAGAGQPSHMEEIEVAPNPEDDAKLRQCKKRRLLPGATGSSQRFDSQFATLRETAAESLRTAPLQEPSKTHSLLFQSTRVIEKVREMQPSWPEQLIRLVAAASVLPRMRLSDAYLREHIYILWLMEGGRFLRVHNGQCFLYHDSGAFQVFRGSPPEQTVARVKEFILQLEGMFRLLPCGVDRGMESIVQCVAKMEEDTEGGIDPMLNTWIAAAIYRQEPERPRRRHGQGLAGSDGEHEGGGRGEPPQMWPQVVANAISKLSVTLQREVMDEKIYGLMIEWCETPRAKRPGCAYYDACVVFDEEGQPVKFVPPSHANNIYTLIPHHLKPAIPDPILAAAPCLDCSMLLFPLAFWYSSFKCNYTVKTDQLQHHEARKGA